MGKRSSVQRFTIWRYAVTFYDTKERFLSEVDRGQDVLESDPTQLWAGGRDALPRGVAEEVAELHPNAVRYAAEAMAPLYKLYSLGGRRLGSRSAHGTESPAMSLRSLSDLPYLSVRRIYEDEDQYPRKTNG